MVAAHPSAAAAFPRGGRPWLTVTRGSDGQPSVAIEDPSDPLPFSSDAPEMEGAPV